MFDGEVGDVFHFLVSQDSSSRIVRIGPGCKGGFQFTDAGVLITFFWRGLYRVGNGPCRLYKTVIVCVIGFWNDDFVILVEYGTECHGQSLRSTVCCDNLIFCILYAIISLEISDD